MGDPSGRLILGITGHIGAGKTSLGIYLSEHRGFCYTRYSKVLSDWQAEDPGDKGRLRVVGWDVMAGGMQQELNRRLVSGLPSFGSCAVDGLRHPVDYEYLSNSFRADFRLIYIDSPQEVRWRRLQAHYATFEDFIEVDTHPVELHIEALRDKASAILENVRSLKDLYQSADALLLRIDKEAAK